MKRITLLLADNALLLSGCVGVKNSFDCDAITSDTCMTMTKANQLARDKVAKQAGKSAAGGLPSLVNLPATSVVGIPFASRSIVSPPSGMRTASTTLPVFTGMPAGVNTNTITSTLTPHPVVGTPVTTTPSSVVYRPAVSMIAPTPSCQSVRCDNPGSVHPQRSQDQITTIWTAFWVDNDNAFHQFGRVSFTVSPADWVFPARVN